MGLPSCIALLGNLVFTKNLTLLWLDHNHKENTNTYYVNLLKISLNQWFNIYSLA